MCETSKYFNLLSALHLVLLLPPYQRAGYATDEPLQKKKIVSPLRSFPPPPQSKTASGAPWPVTVTSHDFWTGGGGGGVIGGGKAV